MVDLETIGNEFRIAPHPVPLPIGWGEGGRRPGEGLSHFDASIIFENHSGRREIYAIMKRRTFIRSTGLAVAAAGIPIASRAATKSRELQISVVRIQDARGRRLTPVAPNAYAAYRGYDVTEPILRIQTRQGIEGIAHVGGSPESLKQLLGLDPFALFTWDGDRITGPAEAHRELLIKLGGADVALIDLLGKALNRPCAELLGKPVRSTVPAYDSSLYMEDLLKPDQLQGLAYLAGPPPKDPVELVALKARWLLRERPEGFQAVKIKIGRVKWMESFDAALARDIAVTKAVREAIGPDVKLMVDGNKAYQPQPLAAADYAVAVAGARVYFMEEMFPEVDIASMLELKQRLRARNDPVKLAAGESHGGGIPEKVYTQRLVGPNGSEPLLDVEQADMNAHGFLRLRAKAATEAKLGMTMAPHNFGSKMGFYAQVHLGLVTPNWEISEMDDSEFPALHADGIVVRNGLAKLTGQPGLGVHLQEDPLSKPSLDLKA
jgi:D-galactarolactone cycloisomerase